MIEESNTGRYFVLSTPVNVQDKLNGGLIRFSRNAGLSHAEGFPSQPISLRIAGNALRKRSVWACQPAVTRTHPWQPQSDERSRTRMFRFFMQRTKSACNRPIRA